MTPATHVLLLGSYPCKQPLHGGQVRLAEIAAAYARAGALVRQSSVYDENAYQPAQCSPLDYTYPAHSPYRHWNNQAIPLIDDLTAGHYAANDPRAYANLTRLLEPRPNILHLEQPWLLPLVQRWHAEGRLTNIHIVYGSQNIEAHLKSAILRQYGVPGAKTVVDTIAELERQACQLANTVLAVSESDCQTLRTYTSSPVHLAANGIAAWHATASSLHTWRKQLPTSPFALFVGSAHPPNISGFFDMLGPALGCIPPDSKLVVAGSVGPELARHPTYQSWLPLNQSRLQVLGTLDAPSLSAVKSLAHLYLLPITEGGGSNIKTAEALYSGAHVLGTPVSFRGFDDFKHLPGVHCTDDPVQYRQTLARLLHSSSPTKTPETQALRQKLLWNNTLHTLRSLVT